MKNKLIEKVKASGVQGYSPETTEELYDLVSIISHNHEIIRRDGLFIWKGK